MLSLNRFALIDENDIVYTQYTTYTGKSRHEFLSNGQMKDRVISTAFLYGSSKQLCLAVPTDITIMGKQFKACFVQIDIKDIVELLAFDDQERTNFALYSQNGENLSDTELGPVILDHNIFEATKDLFPKETWDEFCKAFAEEKSGSLTSVSNGAQATMFYAPIKETGWQLAVLIRESVIHEQIRAISEQNTAVTKYQVIFILISVLILAVILLVELGTLSKARLEAEKENTKAFESKANTDSLTGIRNKYAYSETEELLDRKIKEKEIQKLGIVVCDINGLKYVNDSFGHAAGDKLIKDASTMICEYFRHGSVFRR
ncbi:MAG: diguanylate cyclase [Lachnospiraceae bacterium]|nr:diguanylate cyclase [Lachnospiraceae bacterium]